MWLCCIQHGTYLRAAWISWSYCWLKHLCNVISSPVSYNSMDENIRCSWSNHHEKPSQAQAQRGGAKHEELEPANKIFVHLRPRGRGRPRGKPKEEEKKPTKRGRPTKERAPFPLEVPRKKTRGRPRGTLNKFPSGCHFQMQCFGCGEGTKIHSGTWQIDGNEKKIWVCKTAKLLVKEMGLAKYKAMIVENRTREGTELARRPERQAAETGQAAFRNRAARCHFGLQCLGSQSHVLGRNGHYGQFRVSVRRAFDGSEEIIQVCSTAKRLLKRIGFDEYEAIATNKRSSWRIVSAVRLNCLCLRMQWYSHCMLNPHYKTTLEELRYRSLGTVSMRAGGRSDATVIWLSERGIGNIALMGCLMQLVDRGCYPWKLSASSGNEKIKQMNNPILYNVYIKASNF